MPVRVRFASLLMTALTLQWAIYLLEDPGPNAIGLLLLSLPILIIANLRKGHPLARVWAMFLAGWAVVVGLMGASLITWAPPGRWVEIALSIGCGLVILGCLSGPRAKEYFGLRCICRSRRVGGYGFFHDRLRCSSCGRGWKRGDIQVDLEVFE